MKSSHHADTLLAKSFPVWRTTESRYSARGFVCAVVPWKKCMLFCESSRRHCHKKLGLLTILYSGSIRASGSACSYGSSKNVSNSGTKTRFLALQASRLSGQMLMRDIDGRGGPTDKHIFPASGDCQPLKSQS